MQDRVRSVNHQKARLLTALGRCRWGLLARNEDGRDPSALYLLRGESESVESDRLSLGRNRTEESEHQAADGVPALARQIGVEHVVQLVDADARIDPPPVR